MIEKKAFYTNNFSYNFIYKIDSLVDCLSKYQFSAKIE